MSTTSWVGPLLWFVVIIAMIPAALWLLRRTPMGTNASAGVMRSIAALPIGPGQRIVTVEVGQGEERRWLVLGITAQQITTLHTMPAQDHPDAPPSSAAPVQDFARL